MGDWPNVNLFARAFNSANQSLPNSVLTAIGLDSESDDTGSLHDGSLTAVPIAGTVAKTNGSNILVGTGTSFTTALWVGAVITVPGGANETKVVAVITDATHITVESNFANTSSGQTATVNKSGRFSITQAGVYLFGATVQFVANNVGLRRVTLKKNAGPVVADMYIPPCTGDLTVMTVGAPVKCVAGDVLDVFAFQSSGGALNSNASPIATVLYQSPG